jgi:1-deoxy-D-xylulose-5-phosphate synthase
VKKQPVALEIGKAEVVRKGTDVVVFGLGAMLPEAQRLAEMLEREGFSAAVINPRFAKPVDRECVAEFGGRCGLVVTLEDHVLAGGFGSAVMETLNELELQVPVVRVGWPDAFIEHGKVESLRVKYGLTAEAALEKARPYLSRMIDHVLAKH